MQGYQHISRASDPWQALECIKRERPDIVLLDLYLPGMDGLHLLTEIRKIDNKIRFLMVSGEADEECINAAATLGAFKFLTKPLDITSLVSSVEACLAI